MTQTYTCARCGETYPLDPVRDIAAVAERERDFPGLKDENAEIVCDDCYRTLREKFRIAGMPWMWQ